MLWGVPNPTIEPSIPITIHAEYLLMRILSSFALLALASLAVDAQNVAAGSRVFVVGAALLELSAVDTSGANATARYRLYPITEPDVVGHVTIDCARDRGTAARERYYLDEAGDTLRSNLPTSSFRARVADWLDDSEILDQAICASPLRPELSHLIVPESIVRRNRTLPEIGDALVRQQYDHRLVTEPELMEVVICAGYLLETDAVTEDNPKVQLALRLAAGFAGVEEGSAVARVSAAMSSEQVVAQAIVDLLGMSSVAELEATDETELELRMRARCIAQLQEIPKAVSTRIRGR